MDAHPASHLGQMGARWPTGIAHHVTHGAVAYRGSWARIVRDANRHSRGGSRRLHCSPKGEKCADRVLLPAWAADGKGGAAGNGPMDIQARIGEG